MSVTHRAGSQESEVPVWVLLSPEPSAGSQRRSGPCRTDTLSHSRLHVPSD